MSAQIQLSAEEIAFIEAKRIADEASAKAEKAEAEALEAQKVAKEAERKKADLERRTKHLQTLAELATALETADTNGLISFKWTVDADTGEKMCEMTYRLGDKAARVELEAYTTGGTNWRAGSHAGYKYIISDFYDNGFKMRKYKNVKSLLKTIAEFQEAADAKLERARITNNLVEETKKLLAKKYPHATLEHIKPNNWSKDFGRGRDTYKVSTTKGTVIFLSNRVGKYGKIELSRAKVNASKELMEDLAAQILKG